MTKFQEYYKLKRLRTLNLLLVSAIIIPLTLWAYLANEMNIQTLIIGAENIVVFIFTDLLLPDFSRAQLYLIPVFETLYMSFLALIISVLVSILMGVLAAKNTTPHPIIGWISRAIISFIRAIPSLVAALFFVATFGIGTFAGVIAIGVAGVGILGKAYAENIEEVDPGQIEAVRASGANWFQAIGQGIWPQFKSSFITWTFYKFDTNIRDASVIGLIGAGGIGYYLNSSIKLFQYKEAAFGIMLIFILILVVEYITSKLRKKVL